MAPSARTALVLVALLAGCVTEAPPATEPNPYAALQTSPVRGLTPDEVQALREGGGARMALPAELNGFPGPKHVLEHADALGLSAEQREGFEDLYARTNGEARRVGAEVLALQVEMEAAFRNGTMDDARLEALGDRLAERWGELRLVHLRAHLRAVELLTPHQVAVYNELRGYGAADHAAHAH